MPATTRFGVVGAATDAARGPRVVREQKPIRIGPHPGENLARRLPRTLGQRIAPHENGTASALFEPGKEAGRLSSKDNRGSRLQIHVCERTRGALDGRARPWNVRRDGNDTRRFSVGGQTGDQPVEDVFHDTRAPVEEEHVAR